MPSVGQSRLVAGGGNFADPAIERNEAAYWLAVLCIVHRLPPDQAAYFQRRKDR